MTATRKLPSGGETCGETFMGDQIDTAVAEPIVRPKREQADRTPKRQPRYHVLLWNDEDHSYAYVMVMLQELFGHTMHQGFQMAEEIDTRGRAIVLTTTKEHAELKMEQIHAFGKDDMIDGCKGSMSASIEPEE